MNTKAIFDPCIDPFLTRGIAVRDRLVIRERVLDPPTRCSLDRLTLPPSLLRISREPFSSSVSLSQSTDYTVTEFVSETVSAFIRIPCFDLLVDEVLFVMTRISRPPLIRPSRYNNVHRFPRILKRLKVYRGLEDILYGRISPLSFLEKW